jgi:hypothetical protein
MAWVRIVSSLRFRDDALTSPSNPEDGFQSTLDACIAYDADNCNTLRNSLLFVWLTDAANRERGGLTCQSRRRFDTVDANGLTGIGEMNDGADGALDIGIDATVTISRLL